MLHGPAINYEDLINITEQNLTAAILDTLTLPPPSRPKQTITPTQTYLEIR